MQNENIHTITHNTQLKAEIKDFGFIHGHTGDLNDHAWYTDDLTRLVYHQ